MINMREVVASAMGEFVSNLLLSGLVFALLKGQIPFLLIVLVIFVCDMLRGFPEVLVSGLIKGLLGG
jgi:hypothetical protein